MESHKTKSFDLFSFISNKNVSQDLLENDELFQLAVDYAQLVDSGRAVEWRPAKPVVEQSLQLVSILVMPKM